MKYLFLILLSFLAIIYFDRQNMKGVEKFQMCNRNLARPSVFHVPRNHIFPKTSRNVLGRPNKCFSCERQMRKYGDKYLNYAFPTKCVSCEKQSKDPYMEGPTKCFNCK